MTLVRLDSDRELVERAVPPDSENVAWRQLRLLMEG